MDIMREREERDAISPVLQLLGNYCSILFMISDNKICTVSTYGAAINSSQLFGGAFTGLIQGCSSRSDNSFHISSAWDAIVKIPFVCFLEDRHMAQGWRKL